MVLSQATLEAAFSAMAAPFHVAAPAVQAGAGGDPRRPCFLSHNVRALAALPPGLIAAELDLGPYIVALTPHRVLAAPYHRLDKAILANHAILAGAPAPALAKARTLGIRYVALCADQPNAAPGPSLREKLLAGEIIPSLTELTRDPGAPIRIWGVKP